MITANMHEAKSRLSEIVAAAERGEEVIICRHNKPTVRLVPVADTVVRRDLIRPPASLRVKLAPGYDPTEPLSEDEWPSDCR
jgi:prevent-host-death family protein